MISRRAAAYVHTRLARRNMKPCRTSGAARLEIDASTVTYTRSK